MIIVRFCFFFNFTIRDRLYELRRQKEKLEEKIEQANRRLAENTPKK